MNENIETLQIKFDGTDDIDIETLTVALKNTVSSLKIIANNVLDENQYCKFKIKDVKKGSFILDITAFIVSNYATFFQSIPTVLSTFNSVLEIKKHLNGSEPQSVRQIDNDTIEVMNNKGNVMNFNNSVIKIYASNDQLDKSLSAMFNKVSTDDDRNGISFSVNNNDKALVTTFEKEDIDNAKKTIDVTKLVNDMEESIMEAVLTVVKPDLYGSSKWQVFLNTTRIDVDIRDIDFLEKVHNNEVSFKANTRLRVKLKTKYKINEIGLPVEGSKIDYTVMEVLEILNVQRQNNSTLF